MPIRPANRLLLLALPALVLGAGAWFAAGLRAPASAGPRQPLALFTSLPLYWNEAGDVSELLAPDAAPHWVRAQIEQRRKLRPVDLLSAEKLAPFEDLLVAQPRALSPAENVALDAWVRAGGHLLLFADPMLTERSSFPIGDRRRPQDVVLLSPILSHWGLELQYDETQKGGETMREVMGVPIPANLAGRFITQGQDNCQLWSGGLMVTCALGKGRIVALADAALLEAGRSGEAPRRALGSLLDSAFAAR